MMISMAMLAPQGTGRSKGVAGLTQSSNNFYFSTPNAEASDFIIEVSSENARATSSSSYEATAEAGGK